MPIVRFDTGWVMLLAVTGNNVGRLLGLTLGTERLDFRGLVLFFNDPVVHITIFMVFEFVSYKVSVVMAISLSLIIDSLIPELSVVSVAGVPILGHSSRGCRRRAHCGAEGVLHR